MDANSIHIKCMCERSISVLDIKRQGKAFSCSDITYTFEVQGQRYAIYIKRKLKTFNSNYIVSIVYLSYVTLLSKELSCSASIRYFITSLRL